MNTKRIATVKATGEKYVVQQIDFRSNKVHCWGEVVSYRGLSTKHAGVKAFVVGTVDVAEVAWTQALVDQLFAQASRAANAHQLPGYLSDAEARQQRAEQRVVRAAAQRVVDATLRGDFEPLYAFLNK